MKLAIASNNGVTIQRHFGRTSQYVVVTIEDGEEIAREVRTMDARPNLLEVGQHGDHEHGHGHGQGQGNHHRRHRSLLTPIEDCDVLIAGGMGRPMAQAAEASGVDLILTNERLVDDIVASYLDGSLEHKADLAHDPGH